jgi:hypothetical protein
MTKTAMPHWYDWRNLAWVAIGLALILLMRKSEPSYEDKLAPLPVHGQLKQRVVARNFAVNVHGFALAQSYQTAPDYKHDDGQILRTPGVFMSVGTDLEALQETGYISARLHTKNGAYYDANKDERPHARGINIEGDELQPGLTEHGWLFFELPPDQVPGAHVQFYWGIDDSLAQTNDSLIDIDLQTGTANEVAAKTKPMIDLRP